MMNKTTFEKSNLEWQLQQLQQNFSEWWELQWSKWFGFVPRLDVPRIEDPDFWLHLIANLLILFALGLIAWLIWKTRRRWLGYFSQMKGIHLPVLNTTETFSVEYWTKRSRYFQQKGDYYQACRCLYLAMLQQLHESELILHSSSRTDEEYRLLILELPERDRYEDLLMIHQQLCFGGQPATDNLYHHCQQILHLLSRT
ncbi:MAG: DUF4129 domain-containing protein [Microcystaceae cyanobacterium]